MALSEEEAKRLVALLKEQAKIQQEINSGINGYLEAVKKYNSITETVNANKKIEAEIEARLVGLTGDAYDIEEAKLKILKKETKELEEHGEILRKNLAEAKKTKMVLASVAASGVKLAGSFDKLPSIFNKSFGKLKGYGLFEMDKATRQAALDMGLVGKGSATFTKNVREAAISTNKWGMGVQELAKLQSTYTDELGRNVMLSQTSLENMSALAGATGLGVEGAAKLSAEMENQGLSASKTASYMAQTMNDSGKMGLNASKVVKNISSNMKMLNKYNFKGGVQGLIKMAQTTSKLGVDMNFVAGMADKLFDIEGAVDMSAQLQVMGGEWAMLADPFKLMYMARNDMEGLTEAMGHAAASSAHFNKENGEFEISALEMHKLRKIAEQTGVSYEELATAGKNAAKFSKIKSQIGFSLGSGKEAKEMKEFITNTASLNTDGKAMIMVKGEPKLLSSLGAAGVSTIKAEMGASKTLKERAEAARSFDEKIGDFINMLKTTMLPIIDGIDGVLRPLVNNFMGKNQFTNSLKDIGKSIGEFIVDMAPIAKTIGSLITTLGPKGILAAVIGGKALGWLADKVTWVSNGFLLAQGFNAGANGKGGITSVLTNLATKGINATGSKFGMSGGKMAATAGVAGVAGMGLDMITDATTDPGSGWNIAGKAASGALTGAAMGAFLGPIGAGVGALIGGLTGGIGAYMNRPQNDAMFNSPIHDGKIPGIGKGLGNDFSKNRGIIQGGKITPIDNKDDLLAMKPNGPVDKTLKGTQTHTTMKIEFGELHFKFDDLVVKVPGGTQTTIGKDLLNNPQFTRDISRMIHVETEKAINGGKVKG